jgi:hypothetical protein
MKRRMVSLTSALLFACSVSACGRNAAKPIVSDAPVALTTVAVSSVPVVVSVPDSSVVCGSGEESFQCLLAQQDVTATYGMEAQARRLALRKVFGDLADAENDRVKAYQDAVKQIVDSDTSDLNAVDSLVC